MNRWLAFDIETANPAPEQCTDSYELGVTCAATCASGEVSPSIWYGRLGEVMTPPEIEDFVSELAIYSYEGYSLVGINSTGFDFRVLAECALDVVVFDNLCDLALDAYDPPFQLFCERGFMKGMNAIARGFRLAEQKGSLGGLEAMEAWSDGRANEVLEYVGQDALVTLKIVEACERMRGISWYKDGRVLSHRWKTGRLLTVRECLELPLPDTDWMKARGMEPWTRERFTGWLNHD